jgi:hypothetical protein
MIYAVQRPSQSTDGTEGVGISVLTLLGELLESADRLSKKRVECPQSQSSALIALVIGTKKTRIGSELHGGEKCFTKVRVLVLRQQQLHARVFATIRSSELTPSRTLFRRHTPPRVVAPVQNPPRAWKIIRAAQIRKSAYSR